MFVKVFLNIFKKLFGDLLLAFNNHNFFQDKLKLS